MCAGFYVLCISLKVLMDAFFILCTHVMLTRSLAHPTVACNSRYGPGSGRERLQRSASSQASINVPLVVIPPACDSANASGTTCGARIRRMLEGDEMIAVAEALQLVAVEHKDACGVCADSDIKGLSLQCSTQMAAGCVVPSSTQKLSHTTVGTVGWEGG
jgi:hypothetical protein